MTIIVAVLLPAVQSARESTRRLKCQSHLKQWGLAIHHYHDAHGILPMGDDFKPTPWPGWNSNVSLSDLPNFKISGINFELLDCPSEIAPEEIGFRPGEL